MWCASRTYRILQLTFVLKISAAVICSFAEYVQNFLGIIFKYLFKKYYLYSYYLFMYIIIISR